MSADSIEQWLSAAQGGLSQARLSEVFDLVKDHANWKFPINATVSKVDATEAEIKTAVTWFAGGVPEITDLGHALHVTGAGYYEWIGS